MSQVRHHMLDDHKFWSRNLLPYSYFLQRDGRLDKLAREIPEHDKPV